MLEKDGVLIIDFGGSEDNYFSFFFHEIYLVFEAYLIYFCQKFFERYWVQVHENHGYRRKNKEIFKIAEKCGFKFLGYDEFDHTSELQRSSIIEKL